MNVPNRRPIAARSWMFSQSCAGWLVRRGVSPNAISIFGMFAAIMGGCALAATRWPGYTSVGFLLGAVLIQVRLLCNMFDGMVAIEHNRTSAIGDLYNEIPDRVSDAAILIGAGYSAGGSITLGFVASSLAIFVAYVRAAGRVAGAHQEYCGPMAKQQRMATITVAALLTAMVSVYLGHEFYKPINADVVSIAYSDYFLITLALLLVILGEVITVFRRLYRIAKSLRSSAT